MPDDLTESREHAKPWVVATVQTEALVKARLAVDQIRLSETRNAERDRAEPQIHCRDKRRISCVQT